MKIVLLQEVDKLGGPGDVVDVADGYARNFLIPRRFAASAVKGSVRHAERVRRARDDRVRRAVEEAQRIAASLTSGSVRIPARAGEGGKLFGSITAADVADELAKLADQPIDRHDVRLAEPIRSLGTHEVTVHLHPQVEAPVTVEVVRQ